MLPYLNESAGQVQEQQITSFQGLNRQALPGISEFSDTKNLGSLNLGCISPRQGRTLHSTADTGTLDIECYDGKLAVIGTKFYYDGVLKANLSSTGPKRMAYMNKYIVIFPDKIYYDTINDTIKHMEISITGTSGQFTFYNNKIVFNSGTVPAFDVGDAVTISGCADAPYNNRTFSITAITSTYIMADSNTFEERGTDTESDTEDGTESTDTASTPLSESGIVTIARTVPDLDFICESNNRLWGCDKTTIYCSKLGSFNNFNYYAGLATDSYYTEVGSQGDFTGCIAYNGRVYFFKEDVIHSIYGYMPSNFQVVDISAMGVLKGCERTLAVTNSLLFYLSRDGVMCFDGTMPKIISQQLGNINYTQGVAGGNRQYYYISLLNSGAWELYTYDSDNRLWYKEDSTHALKFTSYKGDTLMLDADTMKVWYINKAGSTEKVSWYAETPDINLLEHEKKAAMRLLIRMELAAGSTITVSIKRNKGEWMQKKTFTGPTTENVYVQIQPLRCENFRIKIEGEGECKIYSISRLYTERSWK